MRTKGTILAVILLAATLTACTNTDSNSSNSTSDISNSSVEVIHVDTDRTVYNDFGSLETAAEIVVVGEFIEESTQTMDYENSETKQSITNATSSNKLKISKVYKGDVNENDVINVSQYYGYNTENGVTQLITFSDLTPMEKGDEWILFLKKGETDKSSYWVVGDYTGRYPIKSNYNANSKSAEALGLYDQSLFNANLYDNILSTYKMKSISTKPPDRFSVAWFFTYQIMNFQLTYMHK